MNGDGVWLDDAGERSQAGYNDEPVPWVRNPEENWFNNSQPHDDSQNEFRFNNGGFPLNPSENLLLLLQQSIDSSSPFQHFTLDSATPQQQQQQQYFLATQARIASLLNVPTTTNNNNPFDDFGFDSPFLGQLNQTPNSMSFPVMTSPPPDFLSSRSCNVFSPLEFEGVASGVFENRAKVLKPLEVLPSSGSEPTLFQKRAAMHQSWSSKMCNSDSSSSEMRREVGDETSTGIVDIFNYESDEHNNNKGKKKGMPAKNLMAERRRRKKLNDRLYMLRSVVPKISKVSKDSYLLFFSSFFRDS